MTERNNAAPDAGETKRKVVDAIDKLKEKVVGAIHKTKEKVVRTIDKPRKEAVGAMDEPEERELPITLDLDSLDGWRDIVACAQKFGINEEILYYIYNRYRPINEEIYIEEQDTLESLEGLFLANSMYNADSCRVCTISMPERIIIDGKIFLIVGHFADSVCYAGVDIDEKGYEVRYIYHWYVDEEISSNPISEQITQIEEEFSDIYLGNTG